MTTKSSVNNKILLTGNPGCGKTTVIRRVLEQYPGKVGGFFTRELREGGVRKGFEIVTLDGKHGILAHVDIYSPMRVSKYGVELAFLEGVAVPAVLDAVSGKGFVVIDEIGPMEILSQMFCQAVTTVIESDAPLLGTIVKRSTPFTEKIKRLPSIELIEVQKDNRDGLVGKILAILSDEPL